MVSEMAGKRPQFTNKDKGYTTPHLNAKKLSGKGDSAVYETAEECKNRTKELFNIDEVDCFWDEPNKRYVAGPMPDDKDETKQPLDSENPVMDDEKPETPEETKESQAEPVEEETEESEDPEDLKKTSNVKPSTAESDFKESEDSEDPLPSEDGKRTYDTSESRGLQPLTSLFKKWAWQMGEDDLIKKIVEEHMEFLNGGREKAEVDGSTVSVIGTSSISECITNAIIHFKYAHEFHGIPPVLLAKLMHLRHQEQYDRYHN